MSILYHLNTFQRCQRNAVDRDACVNHIALFRASALPSESLINSVKGAPKGNEWT